jgi:hypothetical protein
MLGLAIAVSMVVLMGTGAPSTHWEQSRGDPAIVLVTGPAPQPKSGDDRSAEEKMRRRFPQPVKVGDLIGLPLLDDEDRTLGRVQKVVRTAEGKIQLIVPYGGFLGIRSRLVAVPIEVVGIAGRQLAALDMPRAEFDAAPAWSDADTVPVPASDTIRVGLYRR